MGFSRQEYWSGLPFPSAGDLPDPGIEPGSPALQADSLPTEPPGKPWRVSRSVVCDFVTTWTPCINGPNSSSPCCSRVNYPWHTETNGAHQFSSVAQSCPTLCNPMNRSTPGLPVHHQLPEFTQTHVHRVSDAIHRCKLKSKISPNDAYLHSL